MALDDGPRAFEIEDVCARLNVTKPTLYREIRSGRLRSFKMGRRRLVSQMALTEFMRQAELDEAL